MESVLRQPETGEPGRVQLHAEEVQVHTRELIIRELLKPLHQALVGDQTVSSLLIQVASIPGIPDWLHGFASSGLRPLEGIGHPSHEDLRLASQMPQHLSDAPRMVGRTTQLVRGQWLDE